MEPRTSLEIPTGAGVSEPAELREETPGEEANDGGRTIAGSSMLMGVSGGVAAGSDKKNPVMMKMKSDCEDDGDTDTLKKADDDEDGIGRYEEELDPRIQARFDY